MAGLSCATAGRAVGISGMHVSRIERAAVPGASVEVLARLGAVVGLDVRVRAYPGPDPLRDQGQVKLLARLRTRLHPDLRLRAEVPLAREGDPRAWDGWISASTVSDGIPVEAETRIADAQALLRRLQLKQRDGDESTLLLVVAETRANRRAVEAADALFRGAFPGSARSVLAALGDGRIPTTSTLLFL